MTTERKCLYALLILALIVSIVAQIRKAPDVNELYTHVLLIWGLLKLDELTMCVEVEVVEEDPKNE
jgi:hypothetical protein